MRTRGVRWNMDLAVFGGHTSKSSPAWIDQSRSVWCWRSSRVKDSRRKCRHDVGVGKPQQSVHEQPHQQPDSSDANCPTTRQKLLAGAGSQCLVLFRPPARWQRRTHQPRPPFPREPAEARRLVELLRCVVASTSRSAFSLLCRFFSSMENHQAMVFLDTSH